MTRDADFDDLPRRLTTAEVCELARVGLVTLWRRRQKDKNGDRRYDFDPVDRGRQDLYDRDTVLKALGLSHGAPEAEPLTIDVNAFHQARSRPVRDPAPAGGRHLSRVLPGAGATPALRLAVSNPTTDYRRS